MITMDFFIEALNFNLICTLCLSFQNFSGGPWDALNADLMPFAYKVAKAIHPGHYRFMSPHYLPTVRVGSSSGK